MEKVTHPLLKSSFRAGASLNKYRFVKLSSGKIVHCGAGQKAIGLTELDWDNNDMCSIINYGIALVEVGSGGATEGAEAVSDGNGKAVIATNLTATLPTGSTDVLSNAAQPSATIAGGALPQKVLGTFLDTVAEGGLTRLLLRL